ncbi:UNVERIFIED_CONTAM: hypothetical protein FKN15_051577 [Acipenser sinensis]
MEEKEQGALVTACADDTLHLWNLRQKRPAILHSLKFNRERITFCHIPFQSKWLYVGTERGNTHVVNIESFILSGYIIMWNKAIELDSPRDEGKMLIGFESGTVVLWDLRAKKPDFRFYYDESAAGQPSIGETRRRVDCREEFAGYKGQAATSKPPLALRGAGGREAVASEPALTPEHALTTEHNTAQRTPHDPPRRRAQFRARRIVV